MLRSSTRFKPQEAARRLSRAASLAGLVLCALSASASAQTPAQPGRAIDRRPAESRPPVAQYDIGQIVKRLAALEAQVSELKKRNESLTSEVNQLKLKGALASLKGGQGPAPMTSGPSVLDRLNKLEQAMGSHTHYLSGIGVMALNALPGMQDIANKTGAGYAIQQWKDIKVHVTFGTGGGPERTGPPVQPSK